MARQLCVALALPHPVGARLDQARRILDPGRRHMPAHLTLVPPTSIDEVDRACAVVASVATGLAPIQLSLRGAGSFDGRTSTAFLRPVGDLAALAALHALLAVPPFPRLQRPFRPHVTLATRCSPTVTSAVVAAFADYAVEADLDAITVFALGADGWTPLSVDRMGGSRP